MKRKDPLNTPFLVRNAIKLGMTMAGKNISDFDKKTIKLASPRFFSVVPDDNDNHINVLSPSLLSLHNEGEGAEKAFSISNLLKATKMLQKQDQEEMLDLIAEASGVSDIVDDKEKNIKNMKGANGQPLYFTKENVTEIYGEDGLRRLGFCRGTVDLSGVHVFQIEEMNSTGYSMLSKKQLHFLYGKDSPYSSPDVLKRLTSIKDPEELQRYIEHDIAMFSKPGKVSLKRKEPTRYKRQVVLTPLVLVPQTLSNPIILSPVLLSPVVLSPAVLGPFVLSPWLFVPIILSPRVLSPVILNPLAFAPVILSPLVLHPFILSPGIFNPFILSPSVLTPFILSPQVGTPFILSPMALNPLILNPMAMSPLILSPFVLSPIILSPQYIFALVCSPHALSPLIGSNLTISSVVASPSFLS
ncbi:unnamed protein product [Enterobius vermicularis]|uniref:Peptidylprolyl isomerase n=1 Tax=Enterobius vermicularis TaxID=51028 RepID=A0A0N4V524_ENTVE|nr:unnamed protein product [Enterobius vermicularis]